MIQKQYLTSEELQEYRKLITIAIFDTYKHNTRSMNFRNLPHRYNRDRCLHCGQAFLYVKDKRKYRYCSTNCSSEFSYIFELFAKEKSLLEREKYRCAICHKSIIYIVEERWESVTYIREKRIYDIDHIQELVRFEDNRFLQAKMFLDPQNLQILCKSCHKEKTAVFLRERFSRSKTKSKTLEQFI